MIVEKSARSTLPDIDKKKFLVPGSMLCGEFKYIIHKHLQSQLSGGSDALSAEQTLYLFVRNTPPRTGMFSIHFLDSVDVRSFNVRALRSVQRYRRFSIHGI